MVCTGHGEGGLAPYYEMAPGMKVSLSELLAELTLPECTLWDFDTCASGLSVLSESDDWWSLAAAPLVKGAPTVWSSLWVVEDAVTADIKVRAYANLFRGGMNKVRALNEAQRAAIAGALAPVDRASSPDFRDPFFWAPFVVSGVH
jgi:CHAT domain-containing protein